MSLVSAYVCRLTCALYRKKRGTKSVRCERFIDNASHNGVCLMQTLDETLGMPVQRTGGLLRLYGRGDCIHTRKGTAFCCRVAAKKILARYTITVVIAVGATGTYAHSEHMFVHQ